MGWSKYMEDNRENWCDRFNNGMDTDYERKIEQKYQSIRFTEKPRKEVQNGSTATGFGKLRVYAVHQ